MRLPKMGGEPVQPSPDFSGNPFTTPQNPNFNGMVNPPTIPSANSTPVYGNPPSLTQPLNTGYSSGMVNPHLQQTGQMGGDVFRQQMMQSQQLSSVGSAPNRTNGDTNINLRMPHLVPHLPHITLGTWIMPTLAVGFMALAALLFVVIVPGNTSTYDLVNYAPAKVLHDTMMYLVVCLGLATLGLFLSIIAIIKRRGRKNGVIALLLIVIIGIFAIPAGISANVSSAYQVVNNSALALSGKWDFTNLKSSDVPEVAARIKEIAGDLKISPVQLYKMMPESVKSSIPKEVRGELESAISGQ